MISEGKIYECTSALISCVMSSISIKLIFNFNCYIIWSKSYERRCNSKDKFLLTTTHLEKVYLIPNKPKALPLSLIFACKN